LIAYDGSVQAARAMRAFVHLTKNDPSTRTVRLLHVGEDTPEDDYVQLDRARAYLEHHGRDVEMIHRRGKPADVIAEEAGARTPCVVVLGAHGRRGVKRFFFGSTTDRLVRSECTTLFVYH
jgi:nucleotide-binding universal stress UspA family protein